MATLYTRTIGSVATSYHLGGGLYSDGTITLKLVCTYTQSTYNNTSSVSIYVRAECNKNDIPFKLSSWQITGNGPTGSGGESSFTYSTRNMTTKTKSITHLLNGSQTFSSGASVTLVYYDSDAVLANKTFTLSNKSYALPTINVYSAIDFSPASPDMSSTVTLNITKPSTSAFTANGVKIVAEYDSTTTTIYEGTGASTTWAIPDLTSTTPDSTTKTIAIKIQSYRGSTYYTAKEYSLDVSVPTGVVPSCAFDTITDEYGFSSFIANYSHLVVSVKSGTAGSGASIVSYTIEVRETNYQGAVIYSATNTTSSATTSFTMTTPIITATTYVKVTITDSRGRTGHVSRNVSAVAYNQPQISLTAERCNSGGTADPLGEYAKIICTWSITQISTDNQVNGTIDILKSTNGGVTYSTIKQETIAPNTYSGSFYVITALAAASQGWFYSTIADNISSATSSIKAVPKATIPISLFDNGTDVGAAIGQMNASKGFHVYLDMEHRNHAVIPNISASGANSYTVIATFTISGAYADQPVFIRTARRNTPKPNEIAIQWKQQNSADPDLQQISAKEDVSDIYIYKSATSTWKLLYKHSSGSENFAVLDLQMGSRMTSRMSVEFVASEYASLPGTLNTDLFAAVSW